MLKTFVTFVICLCSKPFVPFCDHLWKNAWNGKLQDTFLKMFSFYKKTQFLSNMMTKKLIVCRKPAGRVLWGPNETHKSTLPKSHRFLTWLQSLNIVVQYTGLKQLNTIILSNKNFLKGNRCHISYSDNYWRLLDKLYPVAHAFSYVDLRTFILDRYVISLQVVCSEFKGVQNYFRAYSKWGCGSAVVNVLCYRSEGRRFDPSWCHWNFSLT